MEGTTMNTKLRRSVAALATAFACLVLMAGPASATSPGITSGNLTLRSSNGSNTLNIPWAGSAGTGCGHTFTLANGGTTYDVTQYSSASRHNFLLGAYIVVVTRTGSTPGTITGGTNLDTSATLSLKIEFFNVLNANPATDCATDGAVRCTYTVTLHLGGAVTGWTSSTDTGTLAYAQANLAGGIPCSVPYTTWRNGTVDAGGFSFNL
jgi:hypothetical protein